MIKYPKITTIIPVYNVEAYLRETIESVIGQDIGFAENIEIILVDDGSPDKSELICQEYARDYPNNITYIKQVNSGVSEARNNGLALASGEYVHFLDSDDIISSNAYSSLVNLLENHRNDIDFAALAIEFFEARIGSHPLNYKFTGNRVIDIDKEPNAIILHMATCLMRRTAISHRFDSSIKISEDMKFLSELLRNKKRYGVVSDARYYYRKRIADNSAIDRAQQDPSYYRITPHKVYEQILIDWTENGIAHPYAQWVVMYDLQWRLRQKKQEVLDVEEENEYKNLIQALIKRIDDSIITAQHYMTTALKEYALKIKHGKNNDKYIEDNQKAIYKSFRPRIQVEFIDYDRNSNEVSIECSVQEGSDKRPISVYAADEKLNTKALSVVYREEKFLGDTVYSGQPFIVTFPVNTDNQKLRFYAEGVKEPLEILTKRQSNVPNVKFAYRKLLNGYFLLHKGSHILIRKPAFGRHFAYEMRWSARLLSSLKLKFAAGKMRSILHSTIKSKIAAKEFIHPILLPVVSLVRNVGTLGYRYAYYATKLFVRKEVWLISDRLIAANDNGEVFYDYSRYRGDKDLSIYFVISRKSPDYARLKERNFRVLNGDGLRYRILFLHASKIISSHADDYVINPFTYRVHFLNDLFTFDYVFLQHGIIRNDLSSWLNRYNKNIRLFITSTEQERESILKYPYYYKPEKVLLSGLPRYDLLESKPKSKVILAPTWRHNLAIAVPVIKGRRAYNPEFKKSEYFNFYNRLINDKRLHKVLREKNMTGEFYLHPSFEAQIADFKQNDIFIMRSFPYDYRTAFREGSLMITDYSSVLFDFAYLKKPIIYTQFDQDTFLQNHLYSRGYMDDARDGFGPVAVSYDEAVKEIIDAINSDCTMRPKYKRRAEAFFTWHDNDNSKRVYDAIRSLDARE